MALEAAFLDSHVMHMRHAPKVHKLNYRVWYLCVKMSELPSLWALRWLSHNRPNLYSMYDGDYGETPQQKIVDWPTKIKSEFGLVEADGDITFITMPRLLQYGFNPVSFWFYHDAAGDVRAVLAEVHNTFGERHCYLCRHADGRVITESDWLHADKVFHVSPFMNVSGSYDFRFKLTAHEVGVWINHNVNGQRMLTTSLIGRRLPLTNRKLLTAFFRYPLVTVKVIAMIHWHAIRLVLKGIKYNVKPQPPAKMISQ